MPVETAETRPAAPTKLGGNNLVSPWVVLINEEGRRAHPRPTSPRPVKVVRPPTVTEVVMIASVAIDSRTSTGCDEERAA